MCFVDACAAFVRGEFVRSQDKSIFEVLSSQRDYFTPLNMDVKFVAPSPNDLADDKKTRLVEALEFIRERIFPSSRRNEALEKYLDGFKGNSPVEG